MIRLPFALACLTLAACGQSAQNDSAANVTAEKAPPPPAAPPTPPVQTPVPVSFDWSFYAHGGSGDLFFGDGDWSNEEFILSFTCLPGSGRTGMSLQGPPDMPAQLIVNDESAAITNGGTLPTDHPVLRAFAAEGSLRVVAGATERDLAAKPGTGRTAIESFFAYCAAG